MAKLIGTAGHVDHGKTTLLHALTGIDADRLPEEKARGMTIEIGFAYIDLPKIGRVSIVDVPGHEKLVHNMLVGAMGIDLALLCVAADEGVMPQTREHLQILELLPVERMIVALTRSDLAGYGGSEPAKLAVQDLLARTRFENSPILPVSAMTGVGIDVLLAAIEASLSSPEPEVSRGIWRLPIDRVFSVKGFGCVVTGTLSGGEVKVGDEGAVEPGGIAARVRLIHSHDVPVEAGEPGRRIALNISGPKAEDLHRGQMIGAPGSIFSTQALDAEVRWLERPKHATRVRLSIGAEEAIGKVFLSDGSEDAVQLRLEREVACYKGQPIIIRRYSPPELLGGGRVTIPLAKPRRKSEATSVVSGGTFEDQVRAVLHSHPLGIQTEEICRMLGQSPQSLGNVFERLSASGSALGFAGLWFGEQEWKAAANRFVTALERMHEKNPMKAYLPREAVVAGEKLPWAGKQLDRMIGALAAESKVSVNGTQVKSTGFHVSLNPKQRAFLDRIKGELDKGAVNPPPPRELAHTLHVPQQAVEEMLRLGVESGELKRALDEIFYTMETIAWVEDQMRNKFGGRSFTAAEFRDSFGSSRRYAIPLLEYLDSTGFTLRTADKRSIRR